MTQLGGGNGKPLHYSYLGNPMDRGAWSTTVHGITGSDTQYPCFNLAASLKTQFLAEITF